MTDSGDSPKLVPPEEPGPQPYRETLGRTLRRTALIALFITTAVTLVLPHETPYLLFWLTTYPAVLWFPLGGHYVELAYLNYLRLRLPGIRRHGYATRIAWWFLGGLPLGLGCWWTWMLLGADPGFRLPFWWGMPFFIVAECVAHAVLSISGRPSFWNRRE